MLTQYIWQVAGGFDLSGPHLAQTHYGTSLAVAALDPPAEVPAVHGGPGPGTTVVVSAPESTWWVWSDGANIRWADPADLNNVLVNGSLQWAGGTVVGVDGRANFSGYLAEGDNTGFTLLPPFPNMPNPGLGLINPKGADIHLVIRTHGPASSDPAILHAQLSSFGGGCAGSPSPCANIQASIHHP